MPQHHYSLTIKWTGNKGQGTGHYRSYERSHLVSVPGKADILCSSDPAFNGDPSRYNPEEMFVASLSSCHMLWYLHICSQAGVVVVDYTDSPTGTMEETANGGGYFTGVTLYPKVTVAEPSMVDKANALHHKANELCFIATSVNFLVKHEPTCNVSSENKLT